MWPRQLALRRRGSPELAALALLVLWTLAPLLALLGGDGVFNGAYGLDLPDLMQYMAFVRDSGEHVLISNRFDVIADPHVFLDPVFALSGLLWRLGASIQFALLWWIPVTAAALWVGFRSYVHRLLGSDRRACAVALILAFFYLAPIVSVASWLHWSPSLQFGTQVIGTEMFGGGYAWAGGPAIAIAAMPLFLLCVERLLDPPALTAAGPARPARQYSICASLVGALVTWVHPWQGLTLLGILAGLVIWGRLAKRYLALLAPGLFTAAPLGYYFLLSHGHSAWMRVSGANGFAHFGWWLALTLAPAAVAIPAYRGRDLDHGERMLRLWPVAAIAVYLSLDRTWFYHAFASLSLPLSVLAVRSLRRVRAPAVVSVAALLAVTAPGIVWTVQQLVNSRSQRFFKAGEARALAFLDTAPAPGAVLAPAMPLGEAVPAFAGRQTYVGHYYWTPAYAARAAAAEALFDGRLSRLAASALVRGSRATFLLSDCRSGRVDLHAQLGSLIAREVHFGCATVYELSAAGRQAQTIPASPRRRGTSTT